MANPLDAQFDPKNVAEGVINMAQIGDARWLQSVGIVNLGEDFVNVDADPILSDLTATEKSALQKEYEEHGSGAYIKTDFGWKNIGTQEGLVSTAFTQQRTGYYTDQVAAAVKGDGDAKAKINQVFKQLS